MLLIIKMKINKENEKTICKNYTIRIFLWLYSLSMRLYQKILAEFYGRSKNFIASFSCLSLINTVTCVACNQIELHIYYIIFSNGWHQFNHRDWITTIAKRVYWTVTININIYIFIQFWWSDSNIHHHSMEYLNFYCFIYNNSNIFAG